MVEPMDCSPHNTECFIPEETLGFDAMVLEHEDKCGDALPEEGEDTDDSSEEASEGEREYVFQFQGGMDALALAEEEDESGLQPYERSEKIQQQHYEWLASDKHPITSTSGMPAAKRPRREEEELESSFEEIMESMSCGRRRKSRKVSLPSPCPCVTFSKDQGGKRRCILKLTYNGHFFYSW